MITAHKNRSFVYALLGLVALAACAETELLVHTAKTISNANAPVPTSLGDYKVGKPYQIKGQWYYPAENFEYAETGIASWYGPNFHGKPTANGETFNQNLITAAHRTLPLPSAVRVTNLDNGRAIHLRVNDRGPFARGRIIDLSRRAAQLLGFEKNGTAKVRVEILPDESRQLKLAALNGGGNQPQMAPSPREVVVARPIPNSGQPVQMAANIRTGTKTGSSRTGTMVPVLSGKVKILPVSPAGIYIQTGAFSKLENALRMRDRIYSLGPALISRYFAGGVELYRVRIGPLKSVAMADTTLVRMTDAGVKEAQLIVE
jgi:rare lipoprotein A